MKIEFDGFIDEFNAAFRVPLAEWHTEILNRLNSLQTQGNQIMANVQDVKDVVAAEKAEVKAKLDGLTAEIQALKDQVAQGQAVTPEQLDELIVAVKDIFTPEAGPVIPGTVEPIP